MILLTLGNVGIVGISPISMGGNDLSLTAAIIFLITSTSVSMYLAWYNIRKQQIDEHRKWMLRAMFWMGIIVTMRLIMIIAIPITSYVGGYVTVSTRRNIQLVIKSIVDWLGVDLWTSTIRCRSNRRVLRRVSVVPFRPRNIYRRTCWPSKPVAYWQRRAIDICNVNMGSYFFAHFGGWSLCTFHTSNSLGVAVLILFLMA